MLQFTASGQKIFGTFPLASKLLTILRMILFFLSKTPFFAVVSSLRMPWSTQKASNSFEQYSPPRSVQRVLMVLLTSFSTRALKLLKTEKASNFFCKKYTQVFLKKSSMKVMKSLYLHLKMDLLDHICLNAPAQGHR